MSASLAMAPHLALAALERGVGSETHDLTLSAYLGVALVAAGEAGRTQELLPIGEGLTAIRSMRDRFGHTGCYALQDDERQALRAAVTVADQLNGRLRTDQVQRAIDEVRGMTGRSDGDGTPCTDGCPADSGER